MAGSAGSNTFAGAPALVLETGDTVTCAATDMTTKTKETGEPTQAGSATQTAWWTFTPGVMGIYSFDTLLSPAGADTVLAVYTGSAVNALALIDYNDDDPDSSGDDNYKSRLDLVLDDGVTYHVQATPYSDGDANSVVLRAALVAVLVPGPATGGQGSDWFEFATEIPYNGSSDPTPSADLLAANEPGEPTAPFGGDRTAWWKFTAPATETVGIDLLQSTLIGSDASTWINVYTGSSLTALTLVASGYGNTRMGSPNPFEGLAEMNFDAVGGITYYVQVGLSAFTSDVDYVLRLGKRVITYSDWIQPSEFDVTKDMSEPGGWGTRAAGSCEFLASGTTTVEAMPAVLQGAVNAAIAAAIAAVHLTTDEFVSQNVNASTGVSRFTDAGENVNWSSSIVFGASVRVPHLPAPSVPPYDADAAGYEQASTYSVVESAVFLGADGFYSVTKNELAPGSQHNPSSSLPSVTTKPSISHTFDLVALEGVTDFDDALGWDLTNRLTLARFNVSASNYPTGEGMYHSDTDVDMADCINDHGEFVFMQWMPVSLASFPLDYPTQSVGLIVGIDTRVPQGNITYHLRPPAYRYVYWDYTTGGGVLKVWSEADDEWLWQGGGDSGVTGLGRFKVWDGDDWRIAEPVAGEAGVGRLKVYDGTGWRTTIPG